MRLAKSLYPASMLTSDQFDRARRLASRLAGIALFDRHRDLLSRRGRRLGIANPTAMDALLTAADQGDPEARRRMIGLVTTPHTGFFRRPAHFTAAAQHALEVATNRGRARLWSAAAATGEEPYSLAMALLEAWGGPEVPASVLATDINEDTLAWAQTAEYGPAALRACSPQQRERFFAPSHTAGRWTLRPVVRQLVEFRMLNLIDATWPIDRLFDVIFCRNALMYLEWEHRTSVLARLTSRLAADGLLLLDPVEVPTSAADWIETETPGIYRRR